MLPDDVGISPVPAPVDSEEAQDPTRAWTSIAAASSQGPTPALPDLRLPTLQPLPAREEPPSKKGRSHTGSSLVQRQAQPSDTPPLRGAAASAESSTARSTADTVSVSLPPLSTEINQSQPLLGYCKRGRMGESPILAALPGALSRSEKVGSDTDSHTLTLADAFLNPVNYHLASGVVLERFLQIPAAAQQSRQNRLASSLLLCQQHERQLLEQHLTQSLPPSSLLLYVDGSSYDETPLRVSVKEPLVPAESVADTPLLSQELLLTQGLGRASKSHVVIAKVLQTGSYFVYLVQQSEGPIILTGQHVHPLQSMSHTDGEVLERCLSKTSGVSHAAETFGLKLRTVCCDRGGYNRRGEELLSCNRGQSWSTMLVGCDIHALAGVYSKSFEALLYQSMSAV